MNRKAWVTRVREFDGAVCIDTPVETASPPWRYSALHAAATAGQLIAFPRHRLELCRHVRFGRTFMRTDLGHVFNTFYGHNHKPLVAAA